MSEKKRTSCDSNEILISQFFFFFFNSYIPRDTSMIFKLLASMYIDQRKYKEHIADAAKKRDDTMYNAKWDAFNAATN